MNEIEARVIAFRTFMDRSDGWGRSDGRDVYQRLLRSVEESPGTSVFRVSMSDVERLDISFASETIVELARRYRRSKGFCLVDLIDADLIENIDAAAEKKEQPIIIWSNGSATLCGLKPKEGTKNAFHFAMNKSETRASEFASAKNISIANASMKFKQLWEQGFLLRRESAADTGGVEFVYQRIG